MKKAGSWQALFHASTVARLIFGCHRTAKPIVQAGGDEIDVLTDGNRARVSTGWAGKVKRTILHEQMIVLHSDRPVWSEAEFKADACRGSPSRVVRSAENSGGRVVGIAKAAIGDGAAALDVEQCILDGPTDLAGEQAERFDP